MTLRTQNRKGRDSSITRTAPSAKANLRLLSLAGLFSLVLYTGYYALMCSRSLWERPTLLQDKWKSLFLPIRELFPAEWVSAHRDSPLGLLNDGLYVALIAALFAIYALVVWRLWRGAAYNRSTAAAAFRRIFGFTILFLAVLLVVSGILSSDLYSYISYGRIFAIYHDNPYVSVPADYAWFDKAGWLQWVYWKDTPSVYGPVWLLIAGAVAKIAQALDNDIVTHLLDDKLAASLAHLLNIWLVWRLSALAFTRGDLGRKLGVDMGMAASEAAEARTLALCIAATATYAWNPLMLIEFGANGHNDIFMLTFVLVATWLVLAGRWRLACLALAAACLVKLTALLFVPAFFCWLLWRGSPEGDEGGQDSFVRRAGRVLQAAALFMAAMVLAYLPFWTGPSLFTSITGGPPAQLFVNSLGAVLRYRSAEWLSNLAHGLNWQPFGLWTATSIGARLDWPLRWGALLIAATWTAIQALRVRTFRGMLTAWGATLFLYLVVGSVWFWPWYVSWLLVPVALLGPGRLFKAVLIFTLSALSLYAFYPTMTDPFSELPGYSGLLVIGPPFAYLAATGVTARLRSLRARHAGRGKAPSTPQGASPEGAPAAVHVPVRPHPLSLVLSSGDDMQAQSAVYTEQGDAMFDPSLAAD